MYLCDVPFCFRCSVFLIDKETDELVAKVFDGIQTNNDNEVSFLQINNIVYSKYSNTVTPYILSLFNSLNIFWFI